MRQLARICSSRDVMWSVRMSYGVDIQQKQKTKKPCHTTNTHYSRRSKGQDEACHSFALNSYLQLLLPLATAHTASTMAEHHEGINDYHRREDSSAPFLILHPVSDNSSDDDDDDDSFQQMDASRPSRKLLKRLRKNNPNFRRLDLEDGYMTEWFYRNSQNIVDFLDALRQNTTVEHVSVSGEFMAAMTEIMEAAADARASSPNTNTTIGAMTTDHEEGVDWQFLTVISSLPALHTLEIQEVMDFNGIALPVPLLKQVLQQATKLENLTLRFVELAVPSSNVEENDFDASISSLTNGADQNERNNTTLMGAFRDHPSLREVTFAQLRLGEGLALNTLIRGLASIPNLRKARIHMAHQRQEERRRSYQRNDNDDLEDDDGIDRQALLTPICESNSLELLEVSSLRILDESRMLKAIHANESLKSLELSFTHLSFLGWASVAHLLQLRQEPVDTTDRKNISTTANGTDKHNDRNSCGSLECLRLDHMAGLDNATIYVLCHALIPKTNICIPTLQELRLYNVMDMGAKSWVAIAEMIAANQSLSLLSLENCQGMDDDAVVGIANALAENTTLRQLELQVFAGHCTRFSQTVGQQALVDVLLTGRNITLNRLYTQASGKHEAQLEFYLKLNRAGVRQYVLEQEPFGECGHEDSDLCKHFWKQLSSHMDDLDVLFYVLQTNPPFVMACLRAL